ncbi:MAG: pyridoxal phosphate-dependent aminotransferase [Candidatus Thermoplasmatota archaeon]|nr:pyridoxal phosphate-dependent aminotransferase [Candidatus Thermoplasmatota archaeon]MBS3791003.1 pyridoxal phosphate-dependent aminotransferase [Candidatus Thermoplasmatota archaeon]
MSRGLAGDFSKLRGEPPIKFLTKANRMEREGRDVVRFEIGQPDFDTPENVKDAAKRALDEGFTDYVPTTGIPELKEAIRDDIEETRGFRPSKEQIIVLPGAKPGLFFGLLSIIEMGDEVIYQNPFYFTYDSMIGYMGAKKVQIPLHEEDQFRMTPKQIEERISDETKAILLNSPQNPTGSVLTKEDIKAIAEMAEEHDIYVLSDEIYSKMLYEGLDHHSPAYLDECNERTILIDGFSKAYSMTGWRLGYAIAPEEIIHKMDLLLADAVSCTTSFVQKGGVEALRNSQDFVDHIMEHFAERREAIVSGLNEVPGFSCIYPKGAFYVFPNIKETGMESEELADLLLEEAGVCLLPGTAFGDQGEGYLRLSYASSLEEIEKGIDRMKEAMEKIV